MTQKIKIEVPYGACATKVLNERGEPLAERITGITFRHQVGDLPRLTLEMLGVETVIEGEMEVERITICACCKKDLAESAALPVVDVTEHGDKFQRFASAFISANRDRILP